MPSQDNLLPTTVGVEIEVNQRVGSRAHRDMEFIKGKLARTPGLTQWRVKVDASCGINRGESGPEIVSPILRSFDDLDSIVKVIGLLTEHGFKVNARCGLHVHLGVDRTQPVQRQNFFRFLTRYQEAFFTLAQPSRQDNHFCKRLSDSMVRAIKLGRDNRAWINNEHSSFGHNNYRYFWLNASRDRFNTFEFRLMQSVLDYEFVIGWIHVLLLAYANTVIYGKKVQWGKAKAKSIFILVCTMIEQAGCYNKQIDVKIRQTARNWTMKRYEDAERWQRAEIQRAGQSLRRSGTPTS